MDNEQQIKIIEEIFSNEENIKSIIKAQNKDEIKDIFLEKGMELTDHKFKILKLSFEKVNEKLRNLNPEDLKNISGGADIIDRAKIEGTIGAGMGTLIGIGVGGGLGGIYAIVDTIKKSKDDDAFLKNVWKVIAKASSAALSVGAMGAGIGAIAGIAGGSMNGAGQEWDERYGKKDQ